MNKILQLFDEGFVKDYFNKELPAVCSNFKEVVAVNIKPYKKMVWKITYHVVLGFNIEYIKNNGEIDHIFLVCSAHSSEPRENVFKALSFLWKNGIGEDWIDIPCPLFYSSEFRGVFYIGLKGDNILKQVRDGGETALEKITLTARLFAKLHSLPTKGVEDFNPQSSRIETVIPGVKNVLREMSIRYKGEYDKELTNIYNYFLEKEEIVLSKKENICFIHGDAHLENIIDTGPGRLGIIDFADFCFGDFARDLGTFMQQLEHRLVRVNSSQDKKIDRELKKQFLSEYLSTRRIELDDDLKERIKLYYDWTMLRTAVYFFLKAEREVERALVLLERINLSIKSKDFII